MSIRNLALGALSVSSVAATQLAGNENYASTRALTSMDKRADPTSQFTPTSYSFSVGTGDGSKDYLSPTGPLFKSYSLAADWGLAGLSPAPMPVTVFNVAGEVTCASLTAQATSFAMSDDVWDPSFIQGIILQSSTSFHVNADVASCLTGWGGSLIIKSGQATSNVTNVGLAHVKGSLVPQGPYIAWINGNITLTEVYRSYRDEAQAFTTAAIPTVYGTFVPLSTTVAGLNTLSIPVPSRLYTMNLTNPLPLSGIRFAIKDIFDMAGLKTGCGNRAYYNTYASRSVNSYVVQRLLDQGAIIVGRAKTSSFANGEGPTSDWVDQMCPFNARGDGYQQPSSSSSGPGAAMGQYEWLDSAIGSDSGCSILCPSSSNGIYGMRPTFGAISLEGVMPLSPYLDTAGFFIRDPSKAPKISRAIYGDALKNYTSFPKRIFYPNSSWSTLAGLPAASAAFKFRTALTTLLNATEDIRSDQDIWLSSGQQAVNGNQTLLTFLTGAYGGLISWYQWFKFAVPWFADYGALHSGKKPFIAPSPQVRWGYAAANVSETQYNEIVRRKEYYKSFFNSTVLVADPVTCSSALYVYIFSTGTPLYKASLNAYSGPPADGHTFAYGIYNFAGVPQLNIPVGQVPYNSTITGQTEMLPFAIGINAAEGCDYMIWDIAVALQKAGAIKAVATGPVAFP